MRDALTRAAACSKDRVTGPLYLRRIENTLNRGHPDVEYCYRGKAGVIEMKYISKWPARTDTVVRVPHYTQAQRDELRERYKAGGNAAILIQIADDYLLLKMPQCLLLGRVNGPNLYGLASRAWRGAIDGRELLEELMK